MKYVLCLAIVCVSVSVITGCSSPLLSVGNHYVNATAAGEGRIDVNTNETGGPTTSDSLNPNVPIPVGL